MSVDKDLQDSAVKQRLMNANPTLARMVEHAM